MAAGEADDDEAHDEVHLAVLADADANGSEEPESTPAPQANGHDREVVPIGERDRNEVLALIRELFTHGGPRDREQAIRDVAAGLGYGRLGPKIREVLVTDLQTAVRRGILDNDRGTYALLCQNVERYELDHLVAMLLAAMESGWQSRDDAITAAARHLGYRRTGSRITAAFKSAINAAIRRGHLERDGPELIRRC